MTTLSISVTLPAGAAPNVAGERSVLAGVLQNAATQISSTRDTSGDLKHDGAVIGAWTYEPGQTSEGPSAPHEGIPSGAMAFHQFTPGRG